MVGRSPRQQLNNLVDAELKRRAERVVEVAKITAPVDTGRYRKSIRKNKIPGGWRVSANTPYARYLEFGTRRMRAYRTLGRALDAAKE